MIIALVANEQNGQVQISFEPNNAVAARDIMQSVVDMINSQLPPEQQPKPKSGLIIPATAIPKDAGKPIPNA